MSEITTFFRHCPSCGRRFEIRLVGKKLVKEQLVRKKAQEIPGLPGYRPWSGLYGTQVATPVTEDKPVLVDVKDFQYAYQCKHCGHKWVEMREEEEATTPLDS